MSSRSTSYLVENRNARMHWFYKNLPGNVPFRHTRLLGEDTFLKGPNSLWMETGEHVVSRYHPVVRSVLFGEIKEEIDWKSESIPKATVVKCSFFSRVDKNLSFMAHDELLKGMSDALDKPGTPYQKVGYFLSWFRGVRDECRKIAISNGKGKYRCWGVGPTDDIMLQDLCQSMLFALADYEAEPQWPEGKPLAHAPFPNHSFLDDEGKSYFKNQRLNVNTKVLNANAAARHPLDRLAFFENSAALKQGLEKLSANEILYLNPQRWKDIAADSYGLIGSASFMYEYGVPIVARSILEDDALSQHYFWLATLLRQEKLDIETIDDPLTMVEELRIHSDMYSGIVEFVEATCKRFNLGFGQVIAQTRAWVQSQGERVKTIIERDRLECIRHVPTADMVHYAELFKNDHIPLLVERCIKRGLGDCAEWLCHVPIETLREMEVHLHPGLRICDMLTNIEMLYSTKPKDWKDTEKSAFRALLLNQWHSLQTHSKDVTIVDISDLDL